MQALYQELVTNQKSTPTENRQIHQLLFKINKSIQVLQALQTKTDKQLSQHLFETYNHILAKTSAQLLAAKARYTNLDKEQLVNKKCGQLGTAINGVKSQINSINDELRKINSDLKSVRKNNDFLVFHGESLGQNIKRKSKSNSKSKTSFKHLHQTTNTKLQPYSASERQFHFSGIQNESLMNRSQHRHYRFSARGKMTKTNDKTGFTEQDLKNIQKT